MADTSKKSPEPEDPSSDLRALLLILLLSVIVFFLLLYKTKNPESYERSASFVVQSAESAYEKAISTASDAVGDFRGSVSDPSETDVGTAMPPELPKAEILNASPLEVSPSESGASAPESSTSPSAAPLTMEFSGYLLEFSEPPSSRVTVSVGGSKVLVSRAEAFSGTAE